MPYANLPKETNIFKNKIIKIKFLIIEKRDINVATKLANNIIASG